MSLTRLGWRYLLCLVFAAAGAVKLPVLITSEKRIVFRVLQGVVPPFIGVDLKTGTHHETQQNQTILLGLTVDVDPGVMRLLQGGVKVCAHIEHSAVCAGQRQVHGGAAAVV